MNCLGTSGLKQVTTYNSNVTFRWRNVAKHFICSNVAVIRRKRVTADIGLKKKKARFNLKVLVAFCGTGRVSVTCLQSVAGMSGNLRSFFHMAW